MYGVFDHHRAVSSFPRWVVDDARNCFSQICTSLRTKNEIVFSNLEHFNLYKNKEVLIIGGGPSTNDLELDDVVRDFIWSCNHFYLNPKLKGIKVDLAMLMGEPDIKSKDFLEYRSKYKPYLGFEIHDRWFGYAFDDYDKYFMMHTKFYSKLGIGARMILFAAFLGCNVVKFVGLDGYKSIYAGNHAFEPGKNTLPSSFSEQLYDNQYRYFWKYAIERFPQVQFVNLGGGHEFHEILK